MADIPGLEDVIAGKAVIVPVELTEEMKEHAALQALMTDWADLCEDDRVGVFHVYYAMLSASPYKGTK